MRESRSRSPDRNCIDHNDLYTSGVGTVYRTERDHVKGNVRAKSFETRFKKKRLEVILFRIRHSNVSYKRQNEVHYS